MFDGIRDPYLLHWLWQAYYTQIVIPELITVTHPLYFISDLYPLIYHDRLMALRYHYYLSFYQPIHRLIDSILNYHRFPTH